MNRREFLNCLGCTGALALSAGCKTSMASRINSHESMTNFRVAPMKTIHVGFIGIGERGMAAVHRVMIFPNVEATALCDIRPEAVDEAKKWLKDNKKPGAMHEYKGSDESWKGVCDNPTVDVVYIVTPAHLHVEMSTYAMEAGKHVLVEVPGARTVEDCWRMVETCEKTRRHCMMLENCCYGENEMLALNMCRLGLLGTPVYGEAGYLHSGTTRGEKLSKFRSEWYQSHRGNYYPTHGLGPVAQYMNINRGDRFDYLNSMEGKSVGDLIREGDVRWNGENLEEFKKFVNGPYNSSLIRTVKGKMILLNLSCAAPHPYSRMNTLQGTHGVFMDYPLRIDLEATPGSGPRSHEGFDAKFTAECREKYMHPLWKQVKDVARKVGGHGGMDFIMDLRWVYCLQNGLPLDMDVYDLASWSCLCEVTERSQARRGAPEDIPDFTRGAWQTMKPLGIETIDLAKMGIEDIGDAGPQMSIGNSKEG